MDKEYKLIEILEQDAIFDGKPDFMHGLLVLSVLNFNAIGGTKSELPLARAEGYENPKLYTVRVEISVKEHDNDI